eukprot:2997014-Rhodomonas_salina.1
MRRDGERQLGQKRRAALISWNHHHIHISPLSPLESRPSCPPHSVYSHATSAPSSACSPPSSGYLPEYLVRSPQWRSQKSTGLQTDLRLDAGLFFKLTVTGGYSAAVHAVDEEPLAVLK